MEIVYYCRKIDDVDLIKFQKLLFNKYKELKYPDNTRNIVEISKWNNSYVIYFHVYNNIIRYAILNYDTFLKYKKHSIKNNIKIINIKNFLLLKKIKTII